MKHRFWTLLILVTVLALDTRFVAAGSVAAQKLDKATAAFDAKNYAEAAQLYRELATENPGQGKFWFSLGNAEYNLKNYRAALAPYQRSVELGFNVGASHYNRGCCFALLGESAAAIEAIELAIRTGLRNREDLLRNDTDLASIRDTPEFRARILPVAELGTSREEGWRMDLDYLTKRVAETHYAPFKNISRAEWDKEIARIKASVPEMKDHEIVVALMQLMVRIGDGHTVLGGPREGKMAFHVLPVQFYDFKDGLYVRAAHPDYTRIVGMRVVRVGSLSAKEALERVSTTAQRDNSQQVRWMAARYLSRIEVLDALGISKGLASAEITVADSKGKETRVTLKVVPITELPSHGDAGWVDMAPKTASPPLWRRDMNRYFTLDYLDESKMVYANFRAVLDDSAETVEAFGLRAVQMVEEKKARALVIDVRLNNGGNNFLGRAFLEYILASDALYGDGKLFVITGRETFSACQNFCNWLDRSTAALFVGEPTGSRPNFVGEGNSIILPYSGLVANASSRYWQDSVSEDMRTWIAPELEAEMTSDDYRANRDPALAAILEYLKTRDLAAAKP